METRSFLEVSQAEKSFGTATVLGGVDLSLVREVDRPTGCATISVAAGTGENLIAVASGANAAATADPDSGSLAQFSSGNALKLIVNAVTPTTVRNWSVRRHDWICRSLAQSGHDDVPRRCLLWG